MKGRRLLMILFFGVVLSFSQSGCQVQKNEFLKKKYKIKKDYPPIQRYYNKSSLFRKDKKKRPDKSRRSVGY